MPPKFAPEATASTREPSAEVVDAVFEELVTPEGSVPTVQEQAFRLVPW